MDAIYYILSFLKYLGVIIIFFLVAVVIAAVSHSFLTVIRKLQFTFPNFAGNREITQKHWALQNGGTCAINVQRMVLSIFGINKPESELAERQNAFDMYDNERGACSTTFLLDSYGLKTERIGARDNLNVKEVFYALWKVLKSGRLAICTANSYQLNNPDPEFKAKRLPKYDHAILVTACERDTNGNISIWYADTGHANGSSIKMEGSSFFASVAPIFYATPVLPELGLGASAARWIGAMIVLTISFYVFVKYFRWML